MEDLRIPQWLFFHRHRNIEALASHLQLAVPNSIYHIQLPFFHYFHRKNSIHWEKNVVTNRVTIDSNASSLLIVLMEYNKWIIQWNNETCCRSSRASIVWMEHYSKFEIELQEDSSLTQTFAIFEYYIVFYIWIYSVS